MSRTLWIAVVVVAALFLSWWLIGQRCKETDRETDEEKPPPRKADEIDASTLRHRVLCGYQGWFRCPGDPAGVGWRHWSRDARRIGPGTLTFEMWPDLTEYGDDE